MDRSESLDAAEPRDCPEVRRGVGCGKVSKSSASWGSSMVMSEAKPPCSWASPIVISEGGTASSRGLVWLFRSSVFKRAEIFLVVVGGESTCGELFPRGASCIITLAAADFCPLLSLADDLVAAEALEGCDSADAWSLFSRCRFAEVLGSERI